MKLSGKDGALSRRLSIKSWIVRKLDARYARRSEHKATAAGLEKGLALAHADTREALRMAREGNLAVESLLATEIGRLEKALALAHADAREALRMAREGNLAVESLLATELELRQKIDELTGDGL